MSDKLSRTKLDLSLVCKRCFWLDQKKGIKQPPGFPLTINMAIDSMLKKQFDEYREKQEPHPVMVKSELKLVPFKHGDIGRWRANASGVRWEDVENQFLVFGAVDDIWVDQQGVLYVCDYKATGANQVTVHDSYIRQLEVYQFILRKMGFTVSSTGFWLFAHVEKAAGFENGKPCFNLSIQQRQCNSAWVPQALKEARRILTLATAPEFATGCGHCEYLKSIDLLRCGSVPASV